MTQPPLLGQILGQLLCKLCEGGPVFTETFGHSDPRRATFTARRVVKSARTIF